MRTLSGLAFVVPLMVLDEAARAQCPEWVPNFVTLSGGLSGTAGAQIVFDDGSGPALYIGGSFGSAAQDPSSARLARWNGSQFEALPGAIPNGEIDAFAVFDDGSGPGLYASGDFTVIGGVSASRVARWNGTAWSALGDGFDLSVRTLCVYDAGSGPSLYAGGVFMHSGANPMRSVARWDGSAWTSVGDVAGPVNVLVVGGGKLYAGGSFHSAGGNAADNIASFDGTSWAPASGGGTNGIVRSLCVHDDGIGTRLFVGGEFTIAGGIPAQDIAAYNGAFWSALGIGADAIVNALLSYDDGAGSKLIAAGAFTHAGGSPAGAIAAWNGSTWSSLSSSTSGTVYTLCAYNEGSGPRLFAGGSFTSIGGQNADNFARLAGTTWQAVGAGKPLDGSAFAIEQGDVGDGPKLYVGGDFTHAGLLAANYIAAWDGKQWSSLGTGLDGGASAMYFHTDGIDPALYVAGGFTHAGGVAANGVALWNGTWHALGSAPFQILAFAVFDDGSGSGPALFAGGGSFACLRKWNGVSWLPVGSFTALGAPSVRALRVWNDGTRPALYVAGRFQTVDGTTVNNIAKWDGSSWTALGSGMTETNAQVLSLEVFHDGSGDALYAAGGFAQAGGVSTGAVARWNGTSWSSLTPTPVISVAQGAMRAVNESSGPALYVGGPFFSFNGVITNLYRWDGAAWTGLGPNTYGEDVVALGSYDDGSGHGADLFVGHDYVLGTPPDPAYIVEHRTCAASITPFCYGDGGQLPCPCSNSGVAGRGCDNSSFTGGALLTGTGSTTPDTVVMTTSGTKPTALTILLQGSVSLWPGVSFGDGVRCVGGTLKRLYTKAAVGGVVTVPGPGDPSISARSAALGFPIAPGMKLYYQTHYRDPNATFCPAPQGNTWNVSNGVVIRW
jgi:hypothetical protein